MSLRPLDSHRIANAIVTNDGAYLYNNCAGLAEPDWSQYDAIEIQPCACYATDDDGTTHYEVCDPDVAEIWSVYGHLPDGGVDCITDVATEDEAALLAREYERRVKMAGTLKFPQWRTP